MAHPVNATIDPQLQHFHDHRHASSSSYQHLPLASSDPRHHQQQPAPPHLAHPQQQRSASGSAATAAASAAGGGAAPYALHAAPQLAGPLDDDADDGESVGDEGSGHASPDDTGNAG